MKNKIPFAFIFSVLFFFCSSVNAQKITISGYISDESSGEKLIGATVYETGLKIGTTSNLYGYYSLTFTPSDTITLHFRYVGFRGQVFSFSNPGTDLQLNVKLSPSMKLQTVEITEERPLKIEEKSQMSVIDIPVSQIKSIPALFGEVDVFRSLQLLPGVQSGGEGGTGLYVRGGGPDQNLILLDGAPVYNATHLFGFFSVFNADAIKNVQLTKGGFPARYGGRLSSVVDINMKEGNTQKFKGEGSLGLISSKLTLEGPIIKDRTSFIVSGRRTYIDAFLRPLSKAATQGQGVFGYYFYDLNAKVNHKISDKDHVYLSFYGGDDYAYVRSRRDYHYDGNGYSYRDDFRLGWGNITSTLRWNHVINPKLFANTSLIYSRFRFQTGATFEVDEITQSKKETTSSSFKFLSGIEDISGKVDFDYFPHPDHNIKFGAGNIYHTFNTGALQYKLSSPGVNPLDTSIGNKINAHEMSAYIEDDYRINSRLKVNLGMHLAGFSVNDRFYRSLQPRFTGRYLLSPNLAWKASYAEMMQFIHLLTNAGVGLPTDLWVPATDRTKPQMSRQVATGFARTVKIKESTYEFSLEGYYKWMDNIIDYQGGANFFNQSATWENQVEAGKGWSYGSELFIQKKTGKFTGWAGYTLSWTERQFPTINFGERFPYRYDRRHDVSLVGNYVFSEKIDVSATWVYGTGNSITLPIARYSSLPSDHYFYWNNEIQHYGERNSFRMRAYHRMDLGINFRKKKKWGERTINFSIYNMYNRRNPFFYNIEQDWQGNRQMIQYSLFPLIPSLSYNFKF